MFSRFLRLAALTLFFPNLSSACACGCGIFDVGTSSMYASHAGDQCQLNRRWGLSAEVP